MIRRWDKSKPPRGAFVLNKDCAQAVGLVAWWPFAKASVQLLPDFIGSYHMGTGSLAPFTAITLGDVGQPAGTGTNASNTSYALASAILTAAPLSMSAWGKPTSATAVNQTILSINDGSGSNRFFMGVAITTGKVRAVCSAAGTTKESDTTASVVAGSWNHCGASFDTASRISYLAGIAATPETTSLTPTGLSKSEIGLQNGIGGNSWSGDLSDILLWNVIVTADLFAHLADPGYRFEHWYPLRSRKWISAGARIVFEGAANSGDVAAASSYSGSASWSGNDRFLSVDVSMLGPGVTVTAMTYGGAACTKIGSKSTVTSFGGVECWGIKQSDSGAPAAGANTLAVTLSGSIEFTVEWASYSGVHQTIPTESFNSAQATNVGAADATVNITTVADNDWVHAAIVTDDTSITSV